MFLMTYIHIKSDGYIHAYNVCILCIIMQLYSDSGGQHRPSIQVYIIQLYKYSRTQCITSAYLCIVMSYTRTLVDNTGPVYIRQLYKYSRTQCITPAYLCIVIQVILGLWSTTPAHAVQ